MKFLRGQDDFFHFSQPYNNKIYSRSNSVVYILNAQPLLIVLTIKYSSTPVKLRIPFLSVISLFRHFVVKTTLLSHFIRL